MNVCVQGWIWFVFKSAESRKENIYSLDYFDYRWKRKTRYVCVSESIGMFFYCLPVHLFFNLAVLSFAWFDVRYIGHIVLYVPMWKQFLQNITRAGYPSCLNLYRYPYQMLTFFSACFKINSNSSLIKLYMHAVASYLG